MEKVLRHEKMIKKKNNKTTKQHNYTGHIDLQLIKYQTVGSLENNC